MKTQISAYTFNAAAKKVTFTDYAAIALAQVLAIFNQTAGIIIYAVGDAALNGTVAANVLTLTFDTTGMSNGDKLLIFYEDSNASALAELTVVMQSLIEVLESHSALHGTKGALRVAIQDVDALGGAITTTIPVSLATNTPAVLAQNVTTGGMSVLYGGSINPVSGFGINPMDTLLRHLMSVDWAQNTLQALG